MRLVASEAFEALTVVSANETVEETIMRLEVRLERSRSGQSRIGCDLTTLTPALFKGFRSNFATSAIGLAGAIAGQRKFSRVGGFAAIFSWAEAAVGGCLRDEQPCSGMHGCRVKTASAGRVRIGSDMQDGY